MTIIQHQTREKLKTSSSSSPYLAKGRFKELKFSAKLKQLKNLELPDYEM